MTKQNKLSLCDDPLALLDFLFHGIVDVIFVEHDVFSLHVAFELQHFCARAQVDNSRLKRGNNKTTDENV